MMMRTALVAAAAFLCAAPALADSRTSAARCEATSFRVYFSHGSAALDATTSEMLTTAARNVAGCDYRELRVSLDASSPYAARRGAAIRAAAADANWDATRLEARGATREVSYGPEYAEITMTPERSTTPAPPLPNPEEVGV